MNFGKTICDLRKQKNVTQEELAAELGVTAAAVSKWENGYTLPDILMLCALADHFHVTTDALLGRDLPVKYAIIASENGELGRRIAELAKGYGISARSIHENYPDALAAVKADSSIEYLLIGYHTGFFDDEVAARKLVSVHAEDEDILKDFKWLLEKFVI